MTPNALIPSAIIVGRPPTGARDPEKGAIHPESGHLT